MNFLEQRFLICDKNRKSSDMQKREIDFDTFYLE